MFTSLWLGSESLKIGVRVVVATFFIFVVIELNKQAKSMIKCITATFIEVLFTFLACL